MRYANYYPSSGLYHVSLPLLMGTRLDVLLFGENRRQLESLWSDTEMALYRQEKMLNRFDKESEVAKVNQDAQYSSVRLSEELWETLLDCRRYFELTDGFFDITLSDFGKLTILEDSHSIVFGQYGMMLDFGGYAKGYALRCMRKRFLESGIKCALVNFGNSSVLAIGAHPFGESWPVGIEDPVGGTLITTFHLKDTSLSVSGNTPANPQHIVNTEKSVTVGGDIMVAIVSDDPVDAEALTTAWIASGEEQAPGWMNHFNLRNTYRIK
jgi:thiamine biosynthesis lipoprotein